MIYPLIAGLSAAAAASLLGNFVILRRLSLAADVLSHIALPGLALGLALKVDPFLGGFLFLVFAVLAIWKLEGKTKLPTDALVAVLFTVSLAAGALLFEEEEELLEALFGNIGGIGLADTVLALVGVLVILSALYFFFRPMLLSLLSPDLAAAEGIHASRMQLLFLLLLAMAVALGVKVTGVLLVGALLVFPPAIAQNLARSIRGALVSSVLSGIIATALGIFVASRYGFDAGPLIVLTLAAFFLLSLAMRR